MKAIVLALLGASPIIMAQRSETNARPSAQTFGPAILDLIALDDHGRPVTNLRASDIHLYDNGVAQQIAVLRSNDSGQSVEEPGSYDRSGASPATVILYDLLNIPRDQLSRGTEGIDPLLHALESLKSAENVYLYFLASDGRLDPIRALPTASQVVSSSGSLWTLRAREQINDGLRRLLAWHPSSVPPIGSTMEALATLGANMLQLHGRNTLLWVTQGGLRLGDVPEVSAAFNRVHLAVYTVDQTALRNVGSSEYTAFPRPNPALTLLASLTGGRPYSRDEIQAALTQSAADAQASYEIRYYPQPSPWDGKYHKILITAVQKHIHIRAQAGYYAFSPLFTPEK